MSEHLEALVSFFVLTKLSKHLLLNHDLLNLVNEISLSANLVIKLEKGIKFTMHHNYNMLLFQLK